MKSIATVLIRVFGVFQFLNGLRALISFIVLISTKGDFYISVAEGGAALVYFILAVILWKVAPWISTKLCQDCKEELSLGSLSVEDIYSVAFLSVGLFLLASSLGSSLSWIFYILSQHSMSVDLTQSYYTIFDLLTRCILGIVFIFKGRTLARKLLGGTANQ